MKHPDSKPVGRPPLPRLYGLEHRIEGVYQARALEGLVPTPDAMAAMRNEARRHEEVTVGKRKPFVRGLAPKPGELLRACLRRGVSR